MISLLEECKVIFKRNKKEIKVGDKVEYFGLDISRPGFFERWFYLKPKFFYQDCLFLWYDIKSYIKYGVKSLDIHDFRSQHAKYSAKRLKIFKSNLHGHPVRVTFEEWNEILDKIIWAFDNIENEPDPIYPDNYDHRMEVLEITPEGKRFKSVDERPIDFTPIEEHEKKVREGLDLFAEYYYDLWD